MVPGDYSEATTPRYAPLDPNDYPRCCNYFCAAAIHTAESPPPLPPPRRQPISQILSTTHINSKQKCFLVPTNRRFHPITICMGVFALATNGHAVNRRYQRHVGATASSRNIIEIAHYP